MAIVSMKRPHRAGPTLPPELLERVKEEGKISSKPKHLHSRKDVRKQERQAKKQRKGVYHDLKRLGRKTIIDEPTRPVPSHPKKRPAAGASEGESATKKRRISLNDAIDPSTNVPSKSSRTSKLIPADACTQKCPEKSSKRLAPTIDDILPSINTMPEERDDKEITRLEYLLGLSKKGIRRKDSIAPNYGAEFADDGLDDLLMDADRILAGSYGIHAENAVESGTNILDGPQDEAASSIDSSDENSEMDAESADDEEPVHSRDIPREDVTSLDTSYQAEGSARPQNASEIPESRYIPPYLRSSYTDTDGATENIKLRRQIKGFLNRLSEQNIDNILGEFLALYRSNARNEVTTTITSQVIDGITSHSSLLDAYVILHGTLVASLHKLVGIDFAAHFVESCISAYEIHHKNALVTFTPMVTGDPNYHSSPGKESMNLMALISELYNFQVISCVLIYDLIRDLLVGEVTELNVELLLKITRNSGQQLRRDDPLALRDIVQLVQDKLGDKNSRELGSRVRFMLETLTNLKNNKVKQPATQAQGVDSVTRLRKFLNGLSKKHHVFTHEPLNASLADLRAADKKGKWWLVGSAWTGNPLVDAKHISATAKHPESRPVSTAEETLLKLAHKQGMNTEIRRSIFAVLMSSEDYIHACERLSHLGLSEIQRREIGRVIIHCCGNEKIYNPYYTMIGQHLCRGSHSFQITLQYCLWDFLREIGENEVGGITTTANLGAGIGAVNKVASCPKIRNIAYAYGWWVAKGSISLSVLKAVPLESLKAGGGEFFHAFFAQLFIGSQTTSPLYSYLTLPSNGTLPFGRDDKPLEPLFLKTVAQHATIAAGIYRFLSRTQWQQMTKSASTAEFLNWASEKVKAIIREQLDI